MENKQVIKCVYFLPEKASSGYRDQVIKKAKRELGIKLMAIMVDQGWFNGVKIETEMVKESHGLGVAWNELGFSYTVRATIVPNGFKKTNEESK